MSFKYTICHPDKQAIEYPSEVLNNQQVIDLAKKYHWKEQIDLCFSLLEEQIFYSPSLEFINTTSKYSLTLTADLIDGEISFALWFNRPKKVKILFGLLGQTERMEVDDVWPFTLDESIKYLEHFLNGNYSIIEKLYQK
jgi:hypothetical protein